jgi:class 3 adenylate cyclase
MSQSRRLAAILAADVAGYSRLMGEDEEGTLARLKAIRRELADPKIKEHHGRIVKTGDGLLLEFAASSMRCVARLKYAGNGGPREPAHDPAIGPDQRAAHPGRGGADQIVTSRT